MRETDFIGGIHELPLAAVAEVAVGAFQAADHQIDFAIFVEIDRRRADRVAHWLSHRAALSRDVGEATGAIREDSASSRLRHEEIELPVTIQIGEDGPDLARLKLNRRVFGFHEPLSRAEREQARAGAVEKIGATVCIPIGDGEMISFVLSANSIRSQLGRDRRIFKARAGVAIQTQTEESVGQQDVGPFVAVVIEPGCRRDVVIRFLRQKSGVVFESGPLIGQQLWSRRCREQQVRLAIGIEVRPVGRACSTGMRQRQFAERRAVHLQEGHAAQSVETKIRLAVAIDVSHRDPLSLRPDRGDSRNMREAGHAGDRAEVVAAPAREVALRVVVLQLEAGFHPLNSRGAKLQRHLVPIDHAGDDDLLASEHRLHDADQLVRRPGIAAEQIWLAVAHVPPLATGVGLIPIVADAGLAGSTVVEEDGRLAGFRPLHDRLPFAFMKSGASDVVLDHLAGQRPLQILHLAEQNQVLLPINLLDPQHRDRRRFLHDAPQRVGNLDVSQRRTDEARAAHG